MTTEALARPDSNVVARVGPRPKSAIELMAERLQVDPLKLFQSLAATVFQGASNEEMLGLIVVSNQYRLNPFLKQIYAFPKKGGGIVPIVGIDGWAAIINSEAAFNGCEFLYDDEDDGKPNSCTCVMHVKGRDHPIKVTEYYMECKRNSEPWNAMPRRMLRHKAFMQAGRLAFGLGGIYDEDEGRDIAQGVMGGKAGEIVLPQEEPQVSRTAALTDKLKKQTNAPAEAPTQPTEPGIPSWDELSLLGISRISEAEGIAVQRGVDPDMETLRPDGLWDRNYSAWTVNGSAPEQDQLAREMAARPYKQAPAKTAEPGVPDAAATPIQAPQPRKSNRPASQ